MRIGLIALLFFVTACLKTRSEISESEQRKNSQTVVNQNQKSSESEPLTTPKAEQEVRLQEVESYVRQLNGRIEALEHRANIDTESRQKETSGSMQTQQAIIEQLKIMEEKLFKLESKLSDGAAKVQPTVVSATPTQKGVETKGSAASDVVYAKAEELFASKDWKSAALTYQEYVEKYPKGSYTPDSIYKTGVCFQEMGKKEEAKIFYQEVREKHPKSTAARKAKFRLDNLK